MVVGESGVAPLALEEGRQALIRAIASGARAFYLLLPGADPAYVSLDKWLRQRLKLDLRERFDRESLSFDGLVELVAAVEGVPPSNAVRDWLIEQVGEPVAPARAVIVTVGDHEHFDDLASAAADRDAVIGMLRARCRMSG